MKNIKKISKLSKISFVILISLLFNLIFAACTEKTEEPEETNDDSDITEIIEEEEDLPEISNLTYTGDFSEAFANPERGYNNRVDVMKQRDFTNSKNLGITVLHSYIYLWDYLGLSAENPWSDNITAKLPDNLLEDLQAGLNAVREAGMKIILNPGHAWTWDPPVVANWDIIKEHIRQINEIITKNADVVIAFEAGILGRWGEWNANSANFPELYTMDTNSEEGAAFRYELIKFILETTPDSVLLSIRYPIFIMEAKYLSENPPEGQTALTTAQLDRLGFHNNSFMVEPGDWGSYSTYGQRVWWARISGWANTVVPTNDEIRGWMYNWRTSIGGNMMMGGEVEWSEPTDWGFEGTLLYEQSVPPLRVLSDLENLHTTHMSTDYNGIHIDLWRNTIIPASDIGEPEESVYERMRRRMGYRLRFTEAEFTSSKQAGGEFKIKAEIINDGYAGIVRARPVYIVLESKTGTARYDIILNGVEARLWQTGSHILEESFTLPADMPKGRYIIALWLPDISENLRQNPDYSVRFANTGVWDAQKGYNKLGELQIK